MRVARHVYSSYIRRLLSCVTMNLEEKSLEVREIFKELDQEIQSFMQVSNLGCISGCGFCCANPKVSASVTEFLPLAFELYDKGKADKAIETLENTTDQDFCIVYKSFSEDGEKGMCSDYGNRGMICRLFGSSARKNKTGEKEIITCKKIKAAKKEEYETATVALQTGLDIPGSSDYYTRLYNLDFNLTSEQYPINQAIRKALEAVLTFKYYEQNQE
jgi:uncharacterized protein